MNAPLHEIEQHLDEAERLRQQADDLTRQARADMAEHRTAEPVELELPTLEEVAEKVDEWCGLLATGCPVDSTGMRRRLREALECLQHHAQRLQAAEQGLQAAGEPDTTVVTVGRLLALEAEKEGDFTYILAFPGKYKLQFCAEATSRPYSWCLCDPKSPRRDTIWLPTLPATATGPVTYIQWHQVYNLFRLCSADPTADPEELIRAAQATAAEGRAPVVDADGRAIRC